jgi:hypothetical protein
LVYAYVIQHPKSEALSRGDGHVVYLGTWGIDGHSLVVKYRLVSRTIAKPGEVLPGPFEKQNVQLEGQVMLFEKMRFRRDPRLDADLMATFQGESALLRAHVGPGQP